MEHIPDIEMSLEDQKYIWRIRLELWWDNFKNFLRELSGHPLALLGGILIIVYLLAAIFAPQITVHEPVQGNLRIRLMAPAWSADGDWAYPLGTNSQGRDLLTRIVYGARISLSVGLLSVGISVLIGTLLGMFAGYYGGRFDSIVSRLADLLMAFPFLIFAIGVMAFLGPGFVNLILALTFKGWVEFFRLVRGEMLAREAERICRSRPRHRAGTPGHHPEGDPAQHRPVGVRAGHTAHRIYDHHRGQPEFPRIGAAAQHPGLGLDGSRWSRHDAGGLVGFNLTRTGHPDPDYVHQSLW